MYAKVIFICYFYLYCILRSADVMEFLNDKCWLVGLIDHDALKDKRIPTLIQILDLNFYFLSNIELPRQVPIAE